MYTNNLSPQESNITSKPKAAVIGDPISHSLSPKIHGFLLEKHNLEGTYQAIQTAKNDLSTQTNRFIKEGFAGFNVTIPHKEAIFKLCDYKSKTALLTKAVNTVTFTKDKKLFGHNSDAQGFIDNLKHHQKDIILKGKTAFVIGAGGAARAVIYSLIKEKMQKIYISNRSQSRVTDLINDFNDFAAENNCHLDYLAKNDVETQLDECDLLVNSTSLGMVGQDPLELSLDHLKKTAIVYDIVYNPLMTDLLQQAQKRGNPIVTGIGMLIFQALIGFELWFGQKPEKKHIDALFLFLDNK